ncbi:hypothetical protein KBY65_08740 [Cyanobium sp. Alchichica 3B3-8F6]|uniref:hypothetical protein n=1 Tax=Synechococcales TaxID=1890424 RepID=UPI000B995881|nr:MULTISPECIES: hypothetical protein [Synechococcales]MCP9882566.1 hypothetical protein [Cyanobium sp. Alchichica 3B3-8F6]
MADDTTSSQPRDDRGGRPSGGRPPGNREPGGFRIRLSDNEMRAARAIQDSFGLRSTVAALGLAIRTVAQLLEDGQLDELVAQQRAQAGNRGDGPRGEGARGDRPRGDRRPGSGEVRGDRQDRAPRIDPFARPSKPPAPAPEVVEAVAETDAEAVVDAAVEAAEDAPVSASGDTSTES